MVSARLALALCLSAMILTGRANPDDLVHYWMAPIRGASVNRVNVISTATDGKLFNDADTHSAVLAWWDC